MRKIIVIRNKMKFQIKKVLIQNNKKQVNCPPNSPMKAPNRKQILAKKVNQSFNSTTIKRIKNPRKPLKIWKIHHLHQLNLQTLMINNTSEAFTWVHHHKSCRCFLTLVQQLYMPWVISVCKLTARWAWKNMILDLQHWRLITVIDKNLTMVQATCPDR